MSDVISWEEFNKYMKVGTIIIAHGFIKDKFVEGEVDDETVQFVKKKLQSTTLCTIQRAK